MEADKNNNAVAAAIADTKWKRQKGLNSRY
jgi:uncharacterized membrane protein (UPF0127 family)